MERDGIPPPNDVEIFIKAAELSHLAGKIVYLAVKLGLYTKAPQADFFAVLEDLTSRVVDDERSELLPLCNLMMEFNYQRDELPARPVRFVVMTNPDGTTRIAFIIERK